MTDANDRSTLMQEMLDHYEIRKLLGTYCHGVDRMDEARATSIYARESWDEHGPYSSSGPEFIRGALGRMKQGATKTDSHILGQTLINVDGDSAGAETYFIFVGHSLEDGGDGVLLQLGGRYVDRLVREDGSWKVKKRTCVKDWSITLPIEQDWLKGVDWVEGKRTNMDPSFAALNVTHSGIPGVD